MRKKYVPSWFMRNGYVETALDLKELAEKLGCKYQTVYSAYTRDQTDPPRINGLAIHFDQWVAPIPARSIEHAATVSRRSDTALLRGLCTHRLGVVR